MRLVCKIGRGLHRYRYCWGASSGPKEDATTTFKAVGLVVAVLLIAIGLGALTFDSTRDEGTTRTGKAPNVSPVVTPAEQGFPANSGQLSNPAVQFYLSTGPMRVGFAASEILFVVAEPHSPERGVLVRASFENASHSDPVGTGLLPHRTNYLVGRNQAQWRTNLPSYRQVVYARLYDGIDLVFTATASGAKYTFVIAPGADPAAIGIRFEGMEGLRLDPSGNLVIQTMAGGFVGKQPPAEQGRRRPHRGLCLPDSTTAGWRCSGAAPSPRLPT